MNIVIYVLFLSFWTINCFNTNQSDGFSTTGPPHNESTNAKMDTFRKHLLIIIICVMIVAFVFTCFCFLHYNCGSEESPKTGMIKKEGIADKSAWPSKISLSESKTANLCSLEKQTIISSVDKLSGPSSPEKASIPSSAEKIIRPLSAEKSSKPNSKEKLIKSTCPEKSSIPFSAGKLFRRSSQKKSLKPSSPQKFLGSSHLEKSCKKHILEKLHKPAHAHKRMNPVNLSYPNKPIRSRWPASLRSPARPAKPHCPTHPQNQILSSKASGLRKLAKSPRHRHLKRSASIGKAVMLSKPLLVKTCYRYKDKCLVCKASSEILVPIPESKKENAGNLPSSSKMKSLPKSFQKVDSKDDVYNDDVSDSDVMADDSDDSEREIIIICNIRGNDVAPYGTSHN